MLTASEIRKHVFAQAGRNTYHDNEVDQFVTKVAQTVEDLEREKTEYQRRIAALQEEVEQYRRDEANISKAMVGAQRAAAQTAAEAEKEKERIISSAREKEQTIIASAKQKEEEILSNIQGKCDARVAAAEAKVKDMDAKARDHMIKADNYYNAKIRSADSTAADTIARADDYSSRVIDDALSKKKEIDEAYRKLKDKNRSLRDTLIPIYIQQLEAIKDLPTFDDEAEDTDDSAYTSSDIEKPVFNSRSEAITEAAPNPPEADDDFSVEGIEINFDDISADEEAVTEAAAPAEQTEAEPAPAETASEADVPAESVEEIGGFTIDLDAFNSDFAFDDESGAEGQEDAPSIGELENVSDFDFVTEVASDIEEIDDIDSGEDDGEESPFDGFVKK